MKMKIWIKIHKHLGVTNCAHLKWINDGMILQAWTSKLSLLGNFHLLILSVVLTGWVWFWVLQAGDGDRCAATYSFRGKIQHPAFRPGSAFSSIHCFCGECNFWGTWELEVVLGHSEVSSSVIWTWDLPGNEQIPPSIYYLLPPFLNTCPHFNKWLHTE